MPAPIFSISADGIDVTGNFSGIGVSMTITDGEGFTSDTLQIDIDDAEGSVIAPKTGAILNPIGGYEGMLRDFGLFVVDSVSFKGWPQTISVSAKAVAAKSLAKQRAPKAYPSKDYPTYGHIFADIADQIGVELVMAEDLKSIPNPYEAQAEEDGLEFLNRIGEKINAAVSVKSQRLVVVLKGAGQSVGGVPLDLVAVTNGKNILSYEVTLKDEPKHGEVEASYYDRKKNSREVTTAGTGMEGPKFVIPSPFQSKEDAQRATNAKVKELVRAQADASFVIDGAPFAQAEAWASVTGCRQGVDGLWRIKTVTHTFSSSSPYITSLECEVPSA